jgi:hypothetical protein
MKIMTEKVREIFPNLFQPSHHPLTWQLSKNVTFLKVACLPSRKPPKIEKIIKKLLGDLLYPLLCLPRPYNSSFHLSKPCQLTPTHFHFIHPCQNPKNDFSLMCDTCNSSKRGSFAFPSINRTPPSLI